VTSKKNIEYLSLNEEYSQINENLRKSNKQLIKKNEALIRSEDQYKVLIDQAADGISGSIPRCFAGRYTGPV